MSGKFKFQVHDSDLDYLFWQSEKHIALSKKSHLYHAHHITTCPSGFSDLPTALRVAFDTSKAHTDLIDVLIRLGLFDKLQS